MPTPDAAVRPPRAGSDAPLALSLGRGAGRGPVGTPGAPFLSCLLVLVAAVCLPELVLLGADLGLWGSLVWRPLAYQYGGFWSGLLRDWQANYPAQPALMFVTYAFLHAGPGHLAGNVLTLVPLGRAVGAWLGAGRFLAVTAAAALGGAGAFGLLSDAPAPMVGASGAIFGLAGALVARDWLERRSARALLAAAGALVALNAATWVLMQGQLAWETHGGGALAGGLAAWALGRRAARP